MTGEVRSKRSSIRLCHRKLTLPGVGHHPPARRELIPPAEHLALKAPTRRALPLGLARELLARPGGVRDRIVVGDMGHRVQLAAVYGAARPFETTPLGARRPRPPVANVTQVDRPGRSLEHQRPRDQQLGIRAGIVVGIRRSLRPSDGQWPSRNGGTRQRSPDAYPSKNHRRSPEGPGAPPDRTPQTPSETHRRGPRPCPSLAVAPVPGRTPTPTTLPSAPAPRDPCRQQSRRARIVCRCARPTDTRGASMTRTRASQPANPRHWSSIKLGAIETRGHHADCGRGLRTAITRNGGRHSPAAVAPKTPRRQ